MAQSPAPRRPASYGTAKRLRRNTESMPDGIIIVANSTVMTTVMCDECGSRFALVHRRASENSDLAERQAAWLKDRFVWDHIQEAKHCGSIRLPGLHEMGPLPPGR